MEEVTINITEEVEEVTINVFEGGSEQVQSDFEQTDSTAVDYIKNKPKYQSSGCVDCAAYVDNGDGSITLADGEYSLYDNTDFDGFPKAYEIEGGTFELTDNAVNYIVANYNEGSPTIQVLTDVEQVNLATVAPIYTIVRTGVYLHTLDWNHLSKGLAEKTLNRLVKTRRFERESGIVLSTSTNRTVLVSAGIAWYGATRKNILAFDSATDLLFTYYRSAGEWTQEIGTTYNNSYYDNGTNRVELTANRYAISWVYRGIENQKHCYITYGDGNYNLNDAIAAQPPQPPAIVSQHATLVGKIIIQKGATTPYSVDSAYEVQFNTQPVNYASDILVNETPTPDYTAPEVGDTMQDITNKVAGLQENLVHEVTFSEDVTSFEITGLNLTDCEVVIVGKVTATYNNGRLSINNITTKSYWNSVVNLFYNYLIIYFAGEIDQNFAGRFSLKKINSKVYFEHITGDTNINGVARNTNCYGYVPVSGNITSIKIEQVNWKAGTTLKIYRI